MTTLVRAWRSLTWKHWAWATTAPLLIAMAGPVQSFHQNWYWALWRILYAAPWYLLFSYSVLMAVVVAEATVRENTAAAAWRYVAALVVASAVYSAAVAGFPELVRSPPQEIRSGQVIAAPSTSPEERAREHRKRALFRIPGALSYGWIATFIYVRLRNSRLSARALANAEVERSEAQRRLLAAQLVAAHAQVDPAFVLEKLEEVERTYEADPTRADALLDEFIIFLRDAIPRLRMEEATPAT
jgi:hypothetical protein